MDMDECHRDIDARLNTHLAQAVREHALLDQYADVLRRLPTEPYHVLHFGPDLRVYYYSDTQAQADQLAQECRKVLRVASQRILSFDRVEWLLEQGELRVSINKASLAPGCELVAKEVMTMRYRMVCKEFNLVKGGDEHDIAEE